MFTVTTGADAGLGSLREGINQSNMGNVSTINIAVPLVTLTSAELLIINDVTIVGAPSEVTRDPNAIPFRIFNIQGNNPQTFIVSFSNLTISQGLNNTDDGGGINVANATVILTNVIVSNNESTLGTGGGINATNSLLTLINSTVSNNIIASDGAGIYIAGLSLTLVNTTVTGNFTDGTTGGGDGGGIFASGNPENITTLSITNSTISNNTSIAGGGILTGFVNLTITDSTISNNISGDGGGINTTATNSIITNSTISNNTTSGTDSGGGITIDNDPGNTTTLINVTISENNYNGNGNGSGGIVVRDGIVSLGNTIVANNTAPASNPFSPDVGGIFISLGNNLIGNGSGSIGFINGVNGDQVGTTANPINPLLGPLQFNGGPTQTMALQFGSPAINAGNNNLISSEFDQRGPPFIRINPPGGIIDIGAFEFQFFIICYSGKSKILTKNILTKKISTTNAEDVIAGVHEVLNVNNNSFVPVKINIVTGVVNNFMLIKKNAIGINQPIDDFYVTPGHEIMINNKIIKAKYIPQARRVYVEPQKVYSICTDQRCPIKVNGLNVMTWGYNKWIVNTKKKGINWIDNKVNNNLI